MDFKVKRLNIVQIKSIAADCTQSIDLLDDIIVTCISHEDDNAIISSWVLTHAFEMNPQCHNEKQLESLLKCLKTVKKGTIKRNVLRIFQFVELNEKLAFELFDLAIVFFNDTKEEIAIRAFALTCLEKHIHHFPEIIPEIQFVFEREANHFSPAFKARVNQFNKMLLRRERRSRNNK